MKIIDRPLYTKKIIPFIDKGIIKVLTGQRRVGKSCILQQIENFIKENNPEANIISINKEFEEFKYLQTDEDLSEYLKPRIMDDKNNYLFIDEIQDIKGFENVLRSLQAKDCCDIYITGSNATMLSSELSTYLSGRYIEFHIHSLGYREFMSFHQRADNDETLSLYLTYGGLPYLSRLELTDDMVFEYLRNVYSTILLKDVVKREGIRNVDFLETLSLYTADNVGNLFSASSISKYLKSQRIDISTIQVINYLKALNNAFLVDKIGRIDINGLKKFEIGDKFFFEDIGLRNCRLGFSLQRDIQKLMENAVYLQLSLLEYEIYTGEIGKREIDFVGIKNGKRVYVQVTYMMYDEKTSAREFGNLALINDNYPKYVVSMDRLNRGSDVNGIKHLYLSDFLQLEEL
mgnify:FL=1